MNEIKKAAIGIIGAMQIEVEALCAAMENTESKTIGGITFVYGDLKGKKVVCAKCGIGKVFAAVCAQIMILQYAPACIINSGVAGTLSETLSIGQIALAEQVVQHDMDTSPLGDPVGLISGLNIVHMPADAALADSVCAAIEKTGGNWLRGTIASGDVFVADAAKKSFIRDTFGAIACEMEGAAIGHVCTVNHVPFVVVRAISDGGNEDSPMDYPTFVKIAAARSAEVVQCLLRDM